MTTLLAAARIAAASSAVALLTDRASWAAPADDLLLPEGPEQDVGERPVHRLRHVHREDEARRPVECPGDDQQLAVEHEPHRGGREAGVRVEQRDHRRHVGPADRDDHQHAEEQGDEDDHREEPGLAGVKGQVSGHGHGQGEQRQVDDVLPLVGDRPLRQDLLQFPRGHQAARERERAEDDLQGQHRHREPRHVGRLQVVFGRADQRDAERAEGVAQGGPLRHGRHLHHAQGHADDRAEHQRDGDPRVIDDAVVQQRAGDGQEHPQLARPDSAPRRARRTHPLEREDEQGRGDQVGQLDHVFAADHRCDYLFGPLALNIPSMRSVIRKPPTTLLMAATMAIVPKTVASVLLPSPARMIAPTTAIASSALVSDISGVWSRGETRRITSKPMNAASMNT